MTIETKFDLGQKVYYLDSYLRNVAKKPCTRCDGEGRLKLEGGGTIQCDQCHGSGGEKRSIYFNRPTSMPSEIGKIIVNHYAKKFLRYRDDENIQYMLAATGVGSGTLHREEDVFASIEEAQVRCEELNKRALKNFKSRLINQVFIEGGRYG